jgi:hypothetical protein
MAIDGIWRRGCWMIDVSEVGARLTVETSIAGLNLKEFFLLLSTTGLAYRRCELSWVKANELGVLFIKNAPTKASIRPPTHKESAPPPQVRRGDGVALDLYLPKT